MIDPPLSGASLKSKPEPETKPYWMCVDCRTLTGQHRDYCDHCGQDRPKPAAPAG